MSEHDKTPRDQTSAQTTREQTSAPDLSDAAWEFLRSCARHTNGEFTTFTGDWGNWNYLFQEMWKLSHEGTTDA